MSAVCAADLNETNDDVSLSVDDSVDVELSGVDDSDADSGSLIDNVSDSGCEIDSTACGNSSVVYVNDTVRMNSYSSVINVTSNSNNIHHLNLTAFHNYLDKKVEMLMVKYIYQVLP